MRREFYVYILECADQSYYVGVTNDIDRRMDEHNNGRNENAYTYSRRPVKIRHCEHFECIIEAIRREKQLKGWSRKKKEALFKNDFTEIRKLAGNNKKREIK